MIYELKKLISNRSFVFIILYLFICGVLLCITTLPSFTEKEAYLDSFYNIGSEQVVSSRAQQEKEIALEYDDFLENAKQKKDFLFVRDSFSIQQEKLTRETYNDLNSVKIEAQPSWGLDNYLNSMWMPFFVMGWILLMCTILIHQDRIKIRFLQSTSVASFKLPMQKNGVILFSVFVFYGILFWLGVLIHNLWIPFDWQVSVQSFSFLRACPFSIGIGTYLLWHFFISLLIYMGIACWYIRIYSWFESSIFCISILFSMLIIELILRMIIFPQSAFSLLYWINIWGLLNVEGYLANVTFINIFGNCVSYWMILVFFLVFSFVVLAFPLRYPLLGYRHKRKAKKVHVRSHKQLFYELRKIWLLDGWIYCLPASIILLILSFNFILPTTDYRDQMINSFIDDIGNYVSEESDARIKDWEEQYIVWEQEYKTETSIYRKQEIETSLSTREYFDDYLSIYNSRKESDSELIIPKENQYRLLYIQSFSSTLFVLLQLFITIYLSSGAFFFDRQRKITVLHNLIPDKKKFKGNKNKATFISLALSMLFLWITWWTMIHYIVGSIDVSIPLCALEIFKNNLCFPVWCWQFFNMVISIIFWCILCSILQKIYKKFPKRLWAFSLTLMIVSTVYIIVNTYFVDIWQSFSMYSCLIFFGEMLIIILGLICNKVLN